MPGEGIISIGATVDKTGVDAGLSEIKEGVGSTVASIAVQVEEAQARTRAAWNGLSADIKAAAEKVTATQLSIAEATKRQVANMADLRRATLLTKDANIDASTSTAILAAAQNKVAVGAAVIAAAKREEAEAVARAAEEEGLSSNLIVRAFQRTALGVRESLGEIQEKLVETAETGKLTGEGLVAGFSGFGALLGVGIAGGFAAHWLDEIAKSNVELSHLATQTGLTVTQLAGLQQIVREMGAEWDPVATGLNKMHKAMDDAVTPSRQLVEALAGIGLSLKDLQALHDQPVEQLEMIAKAFAHTKDESRLAGAAVALFGRGGYALIPILKEQGAELSANVQRTGELTGVTEKSAAAAREWTANMAKLTEGFHHFGNWVFENGGKLLAVFDAIGAAIETLIAGIGGMILTVMEGFKGLGKVIVDILRGDFTALVFDAKDAAARVGGVWQGAAQDVKEAWASVAKLWNGPQAAKEMAFPEPGENGDSASSGKPGGKSGKKAAASGGALNFDSPATESPDISGAQKDFIAGLEEEVRLIQNATKEEMQAYRDAAEEKIRLAQEDYQDVERNTEFEVKSGRMSAQQRTQALRQAAEQQRQIVTQLSRHIEILDMNDTRAHSRDLQQEIQLQRQWARVIQQINQQAALDTQKHWTQTFQSLTKGFSSAVSQWVVHGQSFQQSMARIMGGIAENFIQNLVKMIGQEIIAAAMHKALAKQQVFQDAKAAGAAGFRWGTEAGGPILGAIAAAASFAGTLAFQSFAAGGVVMGAGGAAVPVLAHAGERVLSQTQTQNFERMVNASTTNNNNSRNAGDTFNLSIDGARRSFKQDLHAHASDIFDLVRQGYRSGQLTAG
jgi:hypothetical protein